MFVSCPVFRRRTRVSSHTMSYHHQMLAEVKTSAVCHYSWYIILFLSGSTYCKINFFKCVNFTVILSRSSFAVLISVFNHRESVYVKNC